ncbi:HEPN domain-containing protein [Sinomicrobium kalidii]|uniref:HEPN domain-containing protein n=1 Tax=Sinomicrobium kalidii TaxID=2900738 RepID=UPI001E58AD99|nr:HEPN domain-containing protein [Sinomicrobium kalidii]UGU15190.1 HEPN domain-containing protein [Sinomicrobium kalidii]
MKLSSREIIDKITTLLEVQYIYFSTTEDEYHFKSIWIVILKGDRTALTSDLTSMVAKIFQEQTDYLYRIFSFEYAEQQLKDENLFFIHGCHPSKLIYSGPETDTGLKVPVVDEEIQKELELNFGNELMRLNVFMDGATSYMEKKNFSLAAFMLHQYMEIWFRNIELLIMGKERKNHSIKEHQTYIKAFAPKLGSIFNIEQEKERELLNLLDDVYISARYHKNYHITRNQLEIILKKALDFSLIIVRLFENKLEACRKFHSGAFTGK